MFLKRLFLYVEFRAGQDYELGQTVITNLQLEESRYLHNSKLYGIAKLDNPKETVSLIDI